MIGSAAIMPNECSMRHNKGETKRAAEDLNPRRLCTPLVPRPEGGALVSITPRAHDNRIPPRGWRADDLTPEMIEPYRARFGTYFTTSTETECWIWRGATITNGYGRFYRSSRERPTGWLAHRMAWVFATATALTDSLTIDHKCRVPLCVNPAHLEPVTLAENVARAQRAPLADTCRNGHEGEIHTTSGGKRDCRQCHRDRVAEHSRRRRAARSAARAMPPAYDTSKWAR